MIDSEAFRYEKLFKEDTCSFLQAHEDDIEELFQNRINNIQNGISLDDFKFILEEARVMKSEDDLSPTQPGNSQYSTFMIGIINSIMHFNFF